MPGFVNLRVPSHYSFLDGASGVDDLLDAAVALGQDALALTDTNGLYGAVRFWNAARGRRVKRIFGVALRLVDADPVTVLARDGPGGGSLCRIVSLAQLAGEKTKPRATFSLVAGEAAGLIALSESDDAETLVRLREVFGDRVYAELVDRWGPEDIDRCDARAELAAELAIATVVTNDVRYARADARQLHDVLRCIDLRTTVDEAGKQLAANGERWLKSDADLRARLRHPPPAFANARPVADPRAVGPGFRDPRLPGFPLPA